MMDTNKVNIVLNLVGTE